MTHESMTESEFVSDEMRTTDSYAVNEEMDDDDSLSYSEVQSQPGLLSMIIGFFFQTPAARNREISQRINELNVSIEFAPDSATNYVLRGELFLERKEYHLAQADFQTALNIAEAFDETDGWGLIEQAMQDRAIEGLKKVQRRL